MYWELLVVILTLCGTSYCASEHDVDYPIFHVRPEKNWINDPNGPILYNGTFHLFFQYNPNAPIFPVDNQNWGHATSPDLIHWKREQVAIAPTSHSPDDAGVWSGCAVEEENGQVIALYTGVRLVGDNSSLFPYNQTVCGAHALDDSLLTWAKENNPIIATPPSEAGEGFRDPFVFWPTGSHKARHMLLGSGTDKRGGMVLLYTSPSGSVLGPWRYVGVYAEGGLTDKDLGSNWECPGRFCGEDGDECDASSPVVLLVGIDHHVKVFALIGEENAQSTTFSSHLKVPLDGGDTFYATNGLTLEQDEKVMRHIVWGWIPEARPLAEYVLAGWAGVQSVPRRLRITPSGIHVSPVKEVDALRGQHWPQQVIPKNTEWVMVPSILGRALDLSVSWKNTNCTLGLSVLSTKDQKEETSIVWKKRQLGILRGASGSGTKDDVWIEYTPPLDGLGLRVLVDHSVLEVFTIDGVAMTSRVYPKQEDAIYVFVSSSCGDSMVEGWEMTSIWIE